MVECLLSAAFDVINVIIFGQLVFLLTEGIFGKIPAYSAKMCASKYRADVHHGCQMTPDCSRFAVKRLENKQVIVCTL